MARQVKELMAEPVTVSGDATLTEAARLMRDADIGDVIVADGGRPVGVVTDRDIVVRGIAEEHAPGDTTVADVCTRDLVTVSPDDTIEQAAQLMREVAVRRLAVVEGDRLVGVISLGDLAIERDESSALADISAADPNS
jgi:CBS domain-containing protein